MGVFLRKLWQGIPKQWGPWKAVHRSLLLNTEKAGIDPNKYILAMPFWGSGDQIDYAHSIIGTSSNAVFGDSTLDFSTLGATVNMGDRPEFSRLVSGTKTTILFGVNLYTGVDAHFCTVNDEFACRFIGSGGTVYPRFDLFGANSGVSGTINLYQHYEYAWVIDTGTGGGIYLDGSLHKSYSSSDTSADGGEPLIVGARNSAGQEGITGTANHIVVFDTLLSTTQIASLAENPGQLWQPVPQKTYFFPVDAGGGTTVTGILPAMSGLLTTKTAYHRSVEGSI